MSEEMKALIALAEHLGLQIMCDGIEELKDDHFKVSNPEYTYTIAVKA